MSENRDMNISSGIAAFEAKHFSRALQPLSSLAEEGNADAQYRMAIMYQYGLGVVRNEAMAEKWMRAAADQGHALAQHGMGFMYLEGDCPDLGGFDVYVAGPEPATVAAEFFFSTTVSRLGNCPLTAAPRSTLRNQSRRVSPVWFYRALRDGSVHGTEPAQQWSLPQGETHYQ